LTAQSRARRDPARAAWSWSPIAETRPQDLCVRADRVRELSLRRGAWPNPLRPWLRAPLSPVSACSRLTAFEPRFSLYPRLDEPAARDVVQPRPRPRQGRYCLREGV